MTISFEILNESPIYPVTPDVNHAKALSIELGSIEAFAKDAGMSDLANRARAKIDALEKSVKTGGLDLAIAQENGGLIVSHGWREIGRHNERNRLRKAQYESALKGNRNSAEARKWTDANCRDAAREFIKLLVEKHPNWSRCQDKRLTGSHKNGGISALRLEACAVVKALKDPNAAKEYIHRGAKQLAGNGNNTACDLLSKRWF